VAPPQAQGDPMRARKVVIALLALWYLAAAYAPSARAGEHDSMPMESESGTVPRLDLHGFFDVTLGATRVHRAPVDSTALGFALGQFDLFMTSRLAERISFLGEAVIESEDNGESSIDLERAYVRYSFSDRLRVSAGRTHSAVSYWYVTCHHGALLQPTIQRPIPVRFEDEDDGGILPAHAVGAEFSGGETMGSLSLSWVGNLANGRPASRNQVQTTGDANRDKQVGASVTLSGAGALEWHAGGALFHDRTPPSVVTGGEIDQDIASAHLAVRHHWVDEIAEYFEIRNHDRAGGGSSTNHAWYGVVTLGPGRLRPYAAVEGVRIAPGDPFYLGYQNVDRGTAGLRFDVNPFNAIKFEYRNGLSAGERTHDFLLQTAFTF
jgi:hypothetical protein